MPKQDKGAVHTAERLEHHEVEAERLFVELSAKIPKLWEEYNAADGDDDRQKSLAHQIETIQKQADDAFDRWLKLSKQVRDYYKSVAADKREGEKIARADVEMILTQAWRFQRIGRETFIVSIAQDAVRCKDEQDFYTKYAEGIRDCEMGKLREAIANEKFPDFVRECYERSL